MALFQASAVASPIAEISKVVIVVRKFVVATRIYCACCAATSCAQAALSPKRERKGCGSDGDETYSSVGSAMRCSPSARSDKQTMLSMLTTRTTLSGIQGGG